MYILVHINTVDSAINKSIILSCYPVR